MKTGYLLFWLGMSLGAAFGVQVVQMQAADILPTVCRDTSYPAGIRYEFRNIPQNWIEKTGYWYVADDGEMQGNTFIADALTSYPVLDSSGIKLGEAVFGTPDYGVILRGTADTAPCDLPPESAPDAPQCPAWAINSETGELVCLWSLPEPTS